MPACAVDKQKRRLNNRQLSDKLYDGIGSLVAAHTRARFTDRSGHRTFSTGPSAAELHFVSFVADMRVVLDGKALAAPLRAGIAHGRHPGMPVDAALFRTSPL